MGIFVCCRVTESCLQHARPAVPHHLPKFAQVHVYWISHAHGYTLYVLVKTHWSEYNVYLFMQILPQLQIKLLHQFVSFYVIVSQVQIQSSTADFLMLKLRFTSRASFCFARWPNLQFSSFQSLSPVRLFVPPWKATCQASLSITNSRRLLKFMLIESVMPSNNFILCPPLFLTPSVRVFSNESALCIRWPKDWSFSFTISPSNEYSGLISFRIDWLDLLAVQGTIKSLLQHHSSKASILPCSAFFIVQLSHLYMTTSKTIALMRQMFVGKQTSVSVF